MNKPVLLGKCFPLPFFSSSLIYFKEAFGVTSNQASVYQQWWEEITNVGLTGDLIWQAGSELSTGPSPDDGFAVYPTGPVYPLMSGAASALKSRGYPSGD